MRRLVSRGLGLVIAVIVCSVVQVSSVHALPSQGPDPSDFTESNRYGNSYPGSGRTVDYAVATSAYNTILTNTLNIYMTSSSGTITVNNVNICYGTFRAGGRNFDQLDDGTINSSGNAVSFRIGSNTQWGAFDGSGSCDSVSRSFAVSGAAVDPNTGLYKYQLVVSANPATDKYTNTYWVVAPAGSYVSQDSSLPTSSFAMEQTSPIPGGSNPTSTTDPPNPYKNYTNYAIGFAPDCSLTSGSVAKTIEVFDDDNSGNIDVQPRPFVVKLVATDVVSGISNDVPLSVSFPDGFGGSSGPDGSGYYTFYTTANAKRMFINFTAQYGKRYRWIVDSVYYDNTLQFKIPYDSVYYYVGCALPEAQLKAGMTASPSTMSQEDTATFTPSISVAGYRANDSVTCSITRTFYPASGGSSSLGSQPCVTTGGVTPIPITGNGTITLRANTYNSPSTAVPGSRICDTITITDPSASKYYAAAGDNTSTSCVTITKTPNVQFIGDVWAGGGFAAVTPACNIGAKITTSPASSALSDGTTAGSGATYGAFALGKITNFGSASRPMSTGVGDNWTFSNINSGNLGFYGAAQHCIEDYVDRYSSATSLAPGTYSLNNATTEVRHITGDATFSGNLISSTTKIYLVDGNITINGNIAYPSNFNVATEIPSVVLIAKGNIYVNSGVTQMDGIFISRGTFYSCWPKSEPATLSTCNSRLTVNGSVMANAADLFRTAGSDGGTPATRKASAETFNLSPEVFIYNALNRNATSASTSTVTTSNTRELPPRF